MIGDDRGGGSSLRLTFVRSVNEFGVKPARRTAGKSKLLTKDLIGDAVSE